MKRLLLFSIVGLTVFASCKEDDGVTVSTEIKIDEGETIQMIYGESMQLHATRYPEKSLSSIKEWSSSAPNVATVSALGNVTAVGEGEAIITISTIDDLSASCRVVVSTIPITEIKLDKTSEEVLVGESIKIKATAAPDNASYRNSLVFSSTDETVAIVGQDGEVKTVGAGSCKIKVASYDGEIEAFCSLKVLPKEVVNLRLKDMTSLLTIKVGKTYNFEATVLPEDSGTKILVQPIKWTTSDASVATIGEDGKLTAVSVGECIITASSSYDGDDAVKYDVKAECKVVVVQ